MPRPRTVHDREVFAAAALVISRDGPAKLTLARIAKEAGLAAPTLVQRYGSKLGLLRAMSRASKEGSGGFVTTLRARGLSPLDTVREFVLCFAGLAPTPEALINNTLAYLQLDLVDGVLRRNLTAYQQEQERALRGLIEAAVESGALSPAVQPRVLARLLPRLATGSLLAWALTRTGSARDCLRRDLDTVLAGFRPR
ncbi:MAG: TetR/AcrR family transcriptional regulator [Gemmatimonadetes bacterium]|nr:TetR/AcrR family transcriptional regulator [Gemmatimonadota bacterium]